MMLHHYNTYHWFTYFEQWSIWSCLRRSMYSMTPHRGQRVQLWSMTGDCKYGTWNCFRLLQTATACEISPSIVGQIVGPVQTTFCLAQRNNRPDVLNVPVTEGNVCPIEAISLPELASDNCSISSVVWYTKQWMKPGLTPDC